MGLVIISWVEPKINELDLGSGLGPNSLVGPKVNGLDLGSGLGPNSLGWA